MYAQGGQIALGSQPVLLQRIVKDNACQVVRISVLLSATKYDRSLFFFGKTLYETCNVIFLSALEKTLEAGKIACHREPNRGPRLTGDKMFGAGKARFL